MNKKETFELAKDISGIYLDLAKAMGYIATVEFDMVTMAQGLYLYPHELGLKTDKIHESIAALRSKLNELENKTKEMNDKCFYTRKQIIDIMAGEEEVI